MSVFEKVEITNTNVNTNVNTNINENNNKKYILDPLSVIIKLVILSKKDIGTKISVSNNVIYIQEVGIFARKRIGGLRS